MCRQRRIMTPTKVLRYNASKRESRTARTKFSLGYQRLIYLLTFCILLSNCIFLYVIETSSERDEQQLHSSSVVSTTETSTIHDNVPIAPQHQQMSDDDIIDIIKSLNLTDDTAAEYAENWTKEQMEKTRIVVEKRRKKRIKRTRPPPLSASEVEPYMTKNALELLLNRGDDDDDNNSNPSIRNDKASEDVNDDYGDQLRSSDDIEYCGSVAASSDHALNSSSVVLITGILSRIGFQLALKIVLHCDVKVIIGVDAMYPNTISRRLDHLEQLSILNRLVPNLNLIVPHLGMKPKDTRSKFLSKLIDPSDGQLNFGLLKPTHIVHLATFDPYAYRDLDDLHSKDRVNRLSPYNSPDGERISPSFSMRQSLVGTEQLLAKFRHDGMKQHFTLVSTLDVLDFTDTTKDKNVYEEEQKHREFHVASKMMEEVLLESYSQANGMEDCSLVKLRLPFVYGPGGPRGSFDIDLANFITSELKGDHKNQSTFNFLSKLKRHHVMRNEKKEILFVDDAVNAIAAAMQVEKGRSTGVSTFNIRSGEKVSISTFAKMMERIVYDKALNIEMNPSWIEYDKEDLSTNLPTNHNVEWNATIKLDEGIQRLITWQLDHEHFEQRPLYKEEPDSINSRKRKYGNISLDRVATDICDYDDDRLCSKGHVTHSCISECSNPSHCKQSMLDNAISDSHHSTKDCEVVLYTESLGSGVEDLWIDAKKIAQGGGGRKICSVAFVSSDSLLVEDLMRKKNDGVNFSESIDHMKELLEHKGWALILVHGTSFEASSHYDKSLLKISPGGIFHPDVRYALYMENNIRSSHATVDDVLFTTNLLDRHECKSVKFKRDGKLVRYSTGTEKRHASLLLPGFLKPIHSIDQAISSSLDNGHVNENVRKKIKKQRSFYEKIPWYLYKLSITGVPTTNKRYKLQFARSHWVLHDLHSSVGQQFRCQWLEEHIRWGNELDQLSFAYVMGLAEFKWQLVNSELENTSTDDDEDNYDDSIDDVGGSSDSFGLNEGNALLTNDALDWHPIHNNENRPAYVRIVGDSSFDTTIIAERKVWKERL